MRSSSRHTIRTAEQLAREKAFNFDEQLFVDTNSTVNFDLCTERSEIKQHCLTFTGNVGLIDPLTPYFCGLYFKRPEKLPNLPRMFEVQMFQ